MDSCSDYVREKILNRHWRNVNIEKNIKLIHEYGIKTWVNFMLAAPESTTDDDLESIYLSHRCHVTYAAYTMTSPMRGTDLFNYSLQKGYIDNNYDGYVTAELKDVAINYLSKKDEKIRKNIFYLGSIVSKLPFPLFSLGVFIIKHFKPNKIFYHIQKLYLTYNREHVIFKIDKKKEKHNAIRKNQPS